MITVKIVGIDPYSLTQISKEMTDELANLCEVDSDEVNFYAPEGLVVHNGVEQNTRYVTAYVEAPRKIKVLENQIAECVARYLQHIAINVIVLFNYYLTEERHVFFNEEYPRYMAVNNTVNIEEDEFDDEEKDEEIEEIYTGNVFENLGDKLK
ncbi:MAG: hypothetical protein RR578_03085 [Bacilli bacterium]